jgi:hypothetical protein
MRATSPWHQRRDRLQPAPLPHHFDVRVLARTRTRNLRTAVTSLACSSAHPYGATCLHAIHMSYLLASNTHELLACTQHT